MMSDHFDNGGQPHRLPPAYILLLNGFPGVGKFTIAEAIEAKLTSEGADCRLIDNHLLIDPAVAIEPVRNIAHYELRKALRKTALEGLVALDEKNVVFIFTAALSTSDLQTPYDDMDQFSQYVDLAAARNVPLIAINVTCDLDTNCGRLRSEERRRGGKTKLVDTNILQRARRETSLLTSEQFMACGSEGRIYYFEVDNSLLEAELAARGVWNFLATSSWPAVEMGSM